MYKHEPVNLDNLLELPKSFKVGREFSIKAVHYTELMKHSHIFSVGSGKKTVYFNIVYTTSGYLNVSTKRNKACIEYLANNFEIKGVFADEKSNYFADIEYKGRKSRIPFEEFLPNKIEQTLFNKGIAISKSYGSYIAFSHYLQWLLGQFEVQDARQILGFKLNDNLLTWSGVNEGLLQYKLSLCSETEYVGKLNSLIKKKPELQTVICSAAASTTMEYLYSTEKIPIASFGISLVGTSSTGKTTAMILAASFFSSPEDEAVFSGFNGTQNALLHMLGRHHGVPLCYDESTIKNNISNANFIYSFVEGKDKLRLNQDSTLKERQSWMCTCLFSSETPLVDISNNDNLGLGVRIISLDGYTYTIDSAHSEEIKTFSSMNYGIVGNMLSEYFLNADSAEIAQEYNDIKQALLVDDELKQCPLTDRLVQNYTLIIYTSEILERVHIKK